ncbi:hypothetical protein [Nocardia sp. AG03]|uniref:hypothetical protein n=1 Tax=Nocardia sp. AG03 TaxID=3025312 RepID=UPI002418B983|nr:hypothetical protein [Nocardia sp. AG03]
MTEQPLTGGSGRIYAAPARWAARSIADRSAARRRTFPDDRTPAQRLAAEHRREREQARVALDRALRPDAGRIYHAGEFAPLAAVRALGSIDAAELFDRIARERLAEVVRALDWDDPAEIVARVEATAAVLRTLIDRKEVA